MLIMSASGAYIAAFMKPNMGNVFGGVITFYLVATGWLTVKRNEGQTGRIEFGLLLIALAQGSGGLLYGWQAAISATGLKEGYPPAPYLVFGCLGCCLLPGTSGCSFAAVFLAQSVSCAIFGGCALHS